MAEKKRNSHIQPDVKEPKPDHWKQDTPYMQSVVFLMAIEGWLNNLEDGTSAPERVLEHIKPQLNELKTLHRNWLEKKW